MALQERTFDQTSVCSDRRGMGRGHLLRLPASPSILLRIYERGLEMRKK